MAQYIDKSALVAEIESKIKKYYKRGEESDALQDGYGMYWGGVLSCLNEVKTLINTLEVKDVDLEKEYEETLNTLNLSNVQRTVKDCKEPASQNDFKPYQKVLIRLEDGES